MKKLVPLAIVFAAVTVLGTVLTGAANDESSSSKEPESNPTKQCCIGKIAEMTASNVDSPKPICCADVKTPENNVPSCGSCKGDCKEECSTCAEARKDADAVDQADDTIPPVGAQMMGRGHADDAQHAKDHQDFFCLIEHRDDIRRTVKNLPNGVETLTESDVKDVASMIQTHVEAMYDRMEHANPIRMRDPIFREVFANAKKIKLEIEHTDHGVRVTETSEDDYAVKLIQEHAKVVSLWVKNGYSELPKNHPAPKR